MWMVLDLNEHSHFTVPNHTDELLISSEFSVNVHEQHFLLSVALSIISLFYTDAMKWFLIYYHHHASP